MLCWIEVVRLGILVVLLILKEKLSTFHLWVWSRLWVYNLLTLHFELFHNKCWWSVKKKRKHLEGFLKMPCLVVVLYSGLLQSGSGNQPSVASTHAAGRPRHPDEAHIPTQMTLWTTFLYHESLPNERKYPLGTSTSVWRLWGRALEGKHEDRGNRDETGMEGEDEGALMAVERAQTFLLWVWTLAL